MTDVFSVIFFLIFVIVIGVLATLRYGLSHISHQELKVEATSGDPKAKLIYPLHMRRSETRLVLLLLLIFVQILYIIWLNAQVSFLLTVIVSFLTIVFSIDFLPRTRLKLYVKPLLALIAPALMRILTYLAPVMRAIRRFFPESNLENHGISKEDLRVTLKSTNGMPGSDLSSRQMQMLQMVLDFEEKKIRDIMTPARMVKLVHRDDEVGPVLMDELHKSGHSRFPVIAEPKSNEFVGTLYLRDLVGERKSKHVSDLMSPNVRYVHEEDSIGASLQAFLKTRHHLFIVVNSFEEFVGVLSIEDVLEQIIGDDIVDEFDAYDNLRAVATSLAEKERAAREAAAKKAKK